jgi:RNA polymerase sigma factor (sigma-70 family)
MPQAELGNVVRHLRRMVSLAGVRDLADAELLGRFNAKQDEASFAALMERHGRLVWSACWQVLHHQQDAEDAFQATFLVLARQARSIRQGETVASWLYRVAYRTAMKARMNKIKRLAREKAAARMPADKPGSELAWRELQTLLVEELERLPEKYRLPFVLCCVEGKSKSEAAQALGWKEGTVSGRLALARKQMQARLARRGVLLSAALCALALAPAGSAAPLSGRLFESLLQAAPVFAAGNSTVSALSADVVGLARGVIKAMAMTKLKTAILLVLAVGTLVGSAAYFGRPLLTDHAAAAVPQQPETKEAGQRSAENPKGEMMRPAPAAGKKDSAAAVAAGEQAVVAGRVLDSEGKPLPHAHVAVVADINLAEVLGSMIGGGGPTQEADVLGLGQADQEGRYQVRVPRKRLQPAHVVHVIAGAAGHGLSRQTVQTRPKVADTELRVAREEVLKGRLIDLDGLPAAGVKVSVVRLGKLAYPASRQHTMDADTLEPSPIFYQDFPGRGGTMGKTAGAATAQAIQFAAPPANVPFWPQPAVTDAQGRFTLRGLVKGQVLGVQIRDDRYAAVNLDFEPPAQGDTTVLAVGPPHILEGTVSDAVTGKPVPRSRIHVDSFPTYSGGFGFAGDPADEKGRRFDSNYYVSMGPQISRSDFQTDDEGHYRINPFQGLTQVVTVSGPAGQPYLAVRKSIDWHEGNLRQTWNVSLPPGVPVRGKVEESTGKPVAGCRLDFWCKENKPSSAWGPANQNRLMIAYQTRTAADGSFQALLPPGKWYLLANAADEHYLEQKLALEDLAVPEPRNPDTPPAQQYGGKQFVRPDGYATALAKIGKAVEVKIVLRRSTVEGRLVGPNGKPVARARMMYRPRSLDWRPAQEEVRDGRFQFPLPDLVTSRRVLFFDAEGGMGAAVDLSGKDLKSDPVTVRLMPCVSARVRFVDAKGKPVANYRPLVWLMVPPYPSIFATQMMVIEEKHQRSYGGIWLGHADPRHYADGPRTDADGYVTLPNLIAGATYQISQFPRMAENFTAEAGKTVRVADIVIKDPAKPVELPLEP